MHPRFLWAFLSRLLSAMQSNSLTLSSSITPSHGAGTASPFFSEGTTYAPIIATSLENPLDEFVLFIANNVSFGCYKPRLFDEVVQGCIDLFYGYNNMSIPCGLTPISPDGFGGHDSKSFYGITKLCRKDGSKWPHVCNSDYPSGYYTGYSMIALHNSTLQPNSTQLECIARALDHCTAPFRSTLYHYCDTPEEEAILVGEVLGTTLGIILLCCVLGRLAAKIYTCSQAQEAKADVVEYGLLPGEAPAPAPAPAAAPGCLDKLSSRASAMREKWSNLRARPEAKGEEPVSSSHSTVPELDVEMTTSSKKGCLDRLFSRMPAWNSEKIVDVELDDVPSLAREQTSFTAPAARRGGH